MKNQDDSRDPSLVVATQYSFPVFKPQQSSKVTEKCEKCDGESVCDTFTVNSHTVTVHCEEFLRPLRILHRFQATGMPLSATTRLDHAELVLTFTVG